MCGRFQISKIVDDIQLRFHVDVETEWTKQIFNAAPGMLLPVIANIEPFKLSVFKWGLIPSWAKDPGIGNKLINARAETILEKPSFKSSVRHRRCLIPANGFYEWKKEGSAKIAHRICFPDDRLFAFAGLWDRWHDAEGKELTSFTIITTEANDLMKPIHDRMPVILEPDLEEVWLQYDISPEVAVEMLKAYPGTDMIAYPLSSLVNNVRNEGPELIKPFKESLF
ncbi:MAG: SOS response-associated peptidase [Bacteroidota bacterium]